MSGKYILVGHEPRPVEDLMEWAKWFENGERHVRLDNPFPGVTVSTVFLALDHRFISNGPPILFETMVFGGPLDNETRRYCTWDEAEKGHEEILESVRQAEQAAQNESTPKTD